MGSPSLSQVGAEPANHQRRAPRPDHLHPKEGAGLLHHLPQVEGLNLGSRGDEPALGWGNAPAAIGFFE